MVSFVLQGGSEQDAREMVSRTDVFTLAESLGGVESLIEPVIDIHPLNDVQLPNLDKMQALLLTSANGVRAFAERQAGALPDLPVFCVGDATARAARAAGFGNVESAGGDVDDGALLVDGPTMMTGYLGEAGWNREMAIERGGHPASSGHTADQVTPPSSGICEKHVSGAVGVLAVLLAPP